MVASSQTSRPLAMSLRWKTSYKKVCGHSIYDDSESSGAAVGAVELRRTNAGAITADAC